MRQIHIRFISQAMRGGFIAVKRQSFHSENKFLDRSLDKRLNVPLFRMEFCLVGTY